MGVPVSQYVKSAAWTALLGCCVLGASAAPPDSQTPTWAFAVNSPAMHPAVGPDAARAQSVPGSAVRLTSAQTRNLFSVPDWFPDSHPAMPAVVASGRKPAVMACGYCHLPNGQGRPENAPLAALPAPYIAQQLADLSAGNRLAASQMTGPMTTMVSIARNIDATETARAADYFSHLPYKPWIRVIETQRVPRTRIIGWMYQPIPGAGTEPLGQRIIEVPVNVERTELRDSSSGFIAYAPVGSLRRGKALVSTGGNGRTIRCGICHGADLRGLGGVPPIAGRSPSYLMRQLYDMKYGARRGTDTELMREPLAQLTGDDMLSIVAYVASLPP
jgi:cytochrome c553